MHGVAMGLGAPKIQGRSGLNATALSCLRQATGEAHAQLEANLPLLGPEASVSMVGQYLHAILPVVRAAEGIVAQSTEALRAHHYDWDARQRAALLAADVAQFVPPTLAEKFPSAPDLATGSAWAALAPYNDPVGRLGVLYVVEGSSLGGQKLCRHLRSHLAIRDSQLLYLRGYGPQTAAYWRQTCQLLETLLRSDADRTWAGEAAATTFAAFASAIAFLSTTSSSALRAPKYDNMKR